MLKSRSIVACRLLMIPITACHPILTINTPCHFKSSSPNSSSNTLMVGPFFGILMKISKSIHQSISATTCPCLTSTPKIPTFTCCSTNNTTAYPPSIPTRTTISTPMSLTTQAHEFNSQLRINLICNKQRIPPMGINL